MFLFAGKKDGKSVGLLRGCVEKVVELANDGNVKVRTQALELLKGLKIHHGMRFFGDRLKVLDAKKLQSIELAQAAVNQEAMEV